MLGQSTKSQKIIARGKGWEPDAVYDPKTGASVPIDDGLVADAAVFTNQGVPATKGKYPQSADGFDVSIGTGEPTTTFNSPKRRSEGCNAPFPGKSNTGK